MQGITNRKAALVSTLVALRHTDDPEPLIASGRAAGEITRELRGTNGFGFDPVMLIPELNMTFAEMTEEEKNHRSHRGQAARLMRELMAQRWLT
jgi:XTP/dITP diphosphohydrolase